MVLLGGQERDSDRGVPGEPPRQGGSVPSESECSMGDAKSGSKYQHVTACFSERLVCGIRVHPGKGGGGELRASPRNLQVTAPSPDSRKGRTRIRQRRCRNRGVGGGGAILRPLAGSHSLYLCAFRQLAQVSLGSRSSGLDTGET